MNWGLAILLGALAVLAFMWLSGWGKTETRAGDWFKGKDDGADS